jgi:hypothetical protein
MPLSAEQEKHMLPQTAFSLANADVYQAIAFIGGAVFHTGFFIWVLWLLRW